MKFTLIILTVLTPFFAHAGGGGGLRPGMQTMMARNPEVVFNIGEQNGWIKFAHAKLVGKEWQIQKIEMQKTDLLVDDAVIQALQVSQTVKDWAPVKQ